MSLIKDELRHYQRQILLEELGVSGQLRLKQARIAVVGAGGLGSPLLLYLAAAGVGEIRVIDFDKVELHNLHRQILFTRQDIGLLKAEVAAREMQERNPNILVESFPFRITTGNAAELLAGFDLVVDGSDNFETRYAVGDATAALGIPLVSGSIYKFSGQVAVFNLKGGPAYRDLFKVEPATDHLSCSAVGVMGSSCAVVGGFMSNEVIKIITRLGIPLSGKVLQIDLLNMSMHVFSM